MAEAVQDRRNECLEESLEDSVSFADDKGRQFV